MATFGSLFAGIGGIDLGLERAGMECVWQVEINPYCQKVLAKHWPKVKRYEDIREFPPRSSGTTGSQPNPAQQSDGELEPWRVDLICGGFPCQDISYAGKGAGIEGKRSGLWKEFYRVICELRPRFVLVENVPALLRRGLDVVLGDLASIGYDAEWESLPAAAFGAPHRRNRVFVVAYASSQQDNAEYEGHSRPSKQSRESVTSRAKTIRQAHGQTSDDCSSRRSQIMAYASCKDDGQNIRETDRGQVQQPRKRFVEADVADADLKRLQACVFNRGIRVPEKEPPNDGTAIKSSGNRTGSDWWGVEPDVGRVAHGVPSRVDRLRCLGNAVVPQVAEWIGRRILDDGNS